MTSLLWLLLALLPVSALADPLHLGQVILPETRLSGEKIGEFSALVALPQSEVIAVSDRGYLARLHLERDAAGRLIAVDVVAVQVLRDDKGRALRDEGFNPEGAALLPDGTLAIVSESGPRLAVFDQNGLWLRDAPLPEALRDATLQASDKDGIEALAFSPEAGFLAATEEPQRSQPRADHQIHATDGSVWRFRSTGDDISLKAMEIVGLDILLLERSRDDVTDALHPFLRRIPMAPCPQGSCAATQTALPDTGFADADFEGLAVLEDASLLVVSDDKIDGDLRSIFLLFRLQ